MNLLVDSHIVLWLLNEPQRLPSNVIRMLASPENELFVSSLSIFECMIKVQIGKLRIPPDVVEKIRSQRMRILDFNERHATEVLNLPLYHRDPFDRGLLAQARADALTFVTSDETLDKYKSKVDIMFV